MKILLIGKYPPMQGGISSKTFWLFRELEKQGFDYRVVTVETVDYGIKDYDSNKSKTTVIKIKKIPWHIPESQLIADRIFHKAMKTVEEFKPDLIETNYLWPFCMQASLVANILGKPLMIRHAGSDIQKFRHDTEFMGIMKAYFDKAAKVITNRTVETLIEKLCDNTEKVHCLQRYVPDPEIFRFEPTVNKFDILFTGKINYYWNLKGINHLLGLIKHRKLKSLFVIGGKYKNEVVKLLEQTETENYIEVRDFTQPEIMPSIYNTCKYVWCWEEKGSVEDFSNIIWEALFCSTPCIVNAATADRASDEGIPSGLKPFICKTDPDRLIDLDLNFDTVEIDGLEDRKIALYEKYIESNIKLYESLGKSSR